MADLDVCVVINGADCAFTFEMNALNILLIEDEATKPLLAKQLLSNGYAVVCATTPEVDIDTLITKHNPNLIIYQIDSPQKYLHQLHFIKQNHPLPIIMFTADDSLDSINQVIDTDVSAYLINGLEISRIDSIIKVAVARFNRQQRLNNELEKTKARLEERKLIDRAKGILIKTRGFSEDDAYHTLRKLAMDRTITIGEMAKNVIAMAELLK